jgi:hypothetical protein
MSRELLRAASEGDLPKLQRLLREGVAMVNETDVYGRTAFWLALEHTRFQTAQWLLEYGGADMFCISNNRSVWDLLSPMYDRLGPRKPWDPAMTSLLRVTLLRGDAPPKFITSRFSLDIVHLVHKGARLRRQLLAYVEQRRVLLNEHCPLIAPLSSLVASYAAPTAEELLAGLSALLW